MNAEAQRVRETLAAVPLHLLQFHGDEDEAYCRQFGRPYVKAARMRPGSSGSGSGSHQSQTVEQPTPMQTCASSASQGAQ